jgi:L-seryl-tRNA(Ser) seleniumtransferase
MSRASGRRSIPAVEKVLQALGGVDFPRPVVLSIVRRELAALRSAAETCDFDQVLQRLRLALEALGRSRIQPVINGTGVLIHTNLGRAPLGTRLAQSLSMIAAGYCNLEFDLDSGERGRRASYLEHNLAILCGAPAATVVNNCAAALVLVLRLGTSGERKEVIVSRGELVQIGGGFRIPEILQASGAGLREIGTTNMTSLRDYDKAIGPRTALILRVHRSNFFMGGFVQSPSTSELAGLARKRRVLFVEDLGSGAVVQTESQAPIEHEPTPAEVLAQGADLVCFSGDKLFAGVQAGIIAGRAKLVAALKREPFFRALRCDKLILSALQTLVDLYLGGGEGELPLLRMLRVPNEELRARGEKIITSLAGLPVGARLGEAKSQVGGGSLPRSAIPSTTLDLTPQNLELGAFAERLRRAPNPVIGYVSGGRYRLDLRTVFSAQDEALAAAIRGALLK